MDRSVVFAMGSPHSGTSLLTLILGSHSRAFALGEMEDFKGSARCRVCEDRCPIWTSGSRAASPDAASGAATGRS